MEFKKPCHWLSLVHVVKSIDDYIRVVDVLFHDNNFTEGRWYVLEMYTQDVSGGLDDITAGAIVRYYNKFKYRHAGVLGRLRRLLGL